MARLRLATSAATVAYADIFDYPLTFTELNTWHIKKRAVSRAALLENKKIQHFGGYFFLKGRKVTISQRKKRYRASLLKWDIAKRVGWWLQLVPTIQLVGVTGGLAMDNADFDDDIDLFIVTTPHALWISRMIAIVMISMLGRRRKPAETRVANKVCLNMFMSEDALNIPKKQQDVFSAHEVLQMQPLWWRVNTYRVFLQKNQWVEHFLPNAWSQKSVATFFGPQKVGSRIGVWFLKLIEQPAKLFQLWYMQKHRTTEIVTDSVLRFHPRDARVWVKEALRKRLNSQDVPLDKIFYRG